MKHPSVLGMRASPYLLKLIFSIYQICQTNLGFRKTSGVTAAQN